MFSHILRIFLFRYFLFSLHGFLVHPCTITSEKKLAHATERLKLVSIIGSSESKQIQKEDHSIRYYISSLAWWREIVWLHVSLGFSSVILVLGFPCPVCAFFLFMILPCSRFTRLVINSYAVAYWDLCEVNVECTICLKWESDTHARDKILFREKQRFDKDGRILRAPKKKSECDFAL